MADVTVFDGRVCELGEGPFYDELTGRVVWVDILGRRVLWRDGAQEGELRVTGHVGAAVPRRDGGLVLCLPDGPVLVDAAWSDRFAPLDSFATADRSAGIDAPDDGPTLRANDAKADPAGRLWLGTMAYDGTDGAGALYRLDPGETTPRRMLGGITISNGLGWSPDRSTMYYLDTPTRRIDRFTYDVGTGDIGERSVFAEIEPPGYPDGLCVDADGGVWVALWEGGAVHHYHPDGRLARVVAIPTSRVTSCAFAGDGYRTLVVTTAAQGRARDPNAGRTYAYEPGDVSGLPVARFAG
jgi:sugar lactone lactonase YvrE